MKKAVLIVISGLILAGITVGLILYFRSDFRRSLLRVAHAELAKWNGLTELSAKVSQYLIDYWKAVGFNFTASQMQSASVQNNYPWSSAFISYLFFKAGAKDRFPYGASHTVYAQYAKQNRDNPNATLRGFRVNEYAPRVGDLVVYSREAGKGYDTTGHFASHGELVIEKGNGFIKTVGGNVSNTVKTSIFKTDAKGFLTGNTVAFFMVIQNNIK